MTDNVINFPYDEPPPYEPPISDASPDKVIPLGYQQGPTFFYYSSSLQGIVKLTPAEHTRGHLSGMASAPRYWENFEQFQTKQGLSWPQLADWLMSRCRDAGIFDPGKIRGRGAWLEGDKPILHVGDALIIDGERAPLIYPGSKYIYQATVSLLPEILPSLSTAEAHWLVKVCRLLRWEVPAHGTLLAGWIAIAAISGALKWRPSVWLTGSSGSGKSYVMDKIVSACLGQVAFQCAGMTTEAGLRQHLGSDARPVIFDEAESEDQQAAARMQAVLALVRVSASENSPEIAKGTTGQTKGISFRIRSAFMFQSINVALAKRADESRITVLSLRDHSTNGDIAFDDLDTTIRERLTPEFGAGLVSRAVSLIPVIRANAETFARAIASTLGSRRLGDQLGTLMAGAYSLHSSGRITYADAVAYVQREQWAQTHDTADKDERRLLRHLMAAKLKIGTSEMPVSRLLEAAQAVEAKDGLPHSDMATRTLSEAGIKLGAHDNALGVFFSVSHPSMKRILANTDWHSSWGAALARLPDAIHGRALEPQRFSLGQRTRAVWVPMTVIEQ